MPDFVAEFDKRHTEVAACGLIMSEKMRGLILLVRCRIDDATMKLLIAAPLLCASDAWPSIGEWVFIGFL